VSNAAYWHIYHAWIHLLLLVMIARQLYISWLHKSMVTSLFLTNRLIRIYVNMWPRCYLATRTDKSIQRLKKTEEDASKRRTILCTKRLVKWANCYFETSTSKTLLLIRCFAFVFVFLCCVLPSVLSFNFAFLPVVQKR